MEGSDAARPPQRDGPLLRSVRLLAKVVLHAARWSRGVFYASLEFHSDLLPVHVDALCDVLYGLRSQVLHLKNVVISPAQVHPIGVVVSDCTIEAGHFSWPFDPFGPTLTS